MQDHNTNIEAAKEPVGRAIDRLRNRDKVAGTYTVVLDREWAAARLEAVEELSVLTPIGKPTPEQQARIDELHNDIWLLDQRRSEAVIEFKFRHCSPVRYEQLLSDHRPSDEQRKQAAEMGSRVPTFAPSFRPAFVHEVLLEPAMNIEEITELFGETPGGDVHGLLNNGEAAELFTAAMVASNNVPRFETRT